MPLLLVGLNHRTTPVELRERLYLGSEALQNVLDQLHQHSESIDELAIISTCNRFEVYAEVVNLAAGRQVVLDFLTEYFAITQPTLLPHLYICHHEQAVRHLMRVAAGLDSMVLGEAQILGQVGSALADATIAQSTGPNLHRLFETAMHAGKRARAETQISHHTTSISHAAALLMQQKSLQPDPHVVVLGAGDMAELAVYAIHKFSLSHVGVINRTYQNAVSLAEKFSVIAYPWSELWPQLAEADVVISATGAPHTILHREDLQRLMAKRIDKPLMVIDIAVPRDVARDVATIDGLSLHDIDALQHIVDNSLAARQACVPEVEAIIGEEVERYQQWRAERRIVPVIKDLRDELTSVVQSELHDALNKMPDISEADVEVVKRMTHRIMNKVLYAPIANLRSHASAHDADDYAAMVRELFALETMSNSGGGDSP